MCVLYETEREQIAMDAIRRNTLIAAVIVGSIVAALIIAEPTQAAPAQPETTQLDYVYADQYGPPAQAVQALVRHLQSATTTTTAPPVAVATIGDPTIWDTLASCESGGNWSYPPVAGGFSGGLMFHIGTWQAMGGGEYAPDAYLATREQQIDIAERTRTAAGGSMRHWPGCSQKNGWK